MFRILALDKSKRVLNLANVVGLDLANAARLGLANTDTHDFYFDFTAKPTPDARTNRVM